MVRSKTSVSIAIILILFTGLFVSQCDLTSPQRFEETPYIMTSLLHEGEYLTEDESVKPVYIGRAIDIGNEEIEDYFITDADVKLIELDERQEPVDTTPLISPLRDLGFRDTARNIEIKPGYTYRINANIPGEKTLWAKTTVPQRIETIVDSGFTRDSSVSSFPTIKYKEIPDRPIYIKTENDSPVVLYIKCYCMEEYSETDGVSEYTDSYIDEENYQSLRRFKFLSSFQPQYYPRTEDRDAGYYITIDSYQLWVNFYGRHRIRIQSIDENYKSYLHKSNGYFHGGIKNGLGFLGSASGTEVYTKIIE